MQTDYSEYREKLEQLVELLQKYNEDQWANYFTKSLALLDQNKPQKSISHSLGAYGGMGSFNDTLYFTGARENEAKRGFDLRESLWLVCKSKRSTFKRAIEM